MINLNECKKTVYSQNGEDGILSTLFGHLNIEKGYFCEFGAWDGRHLSNTYALYEKGWRGCYIEADPRKFDVLVKSITRQDMQLVNALVAVTGDNTLDEILCRKQAPSKIELLSIDIDSDDLAVWRSVRKYRPLAVIIEYNPTIPSDIVYENPPGQNKGNSALAICRFAAANGYELVATTQSNLVFIDSAANAGKFRTFTLSDGLDLGYRYFFGYDGTLIRMHTFSGKQSTSEYYSVPWVGSLFKQPVAKPFRAFGANRFLAAAGIAMSAVSVALSRPLTAGFGALKHGIKSVKKIWIGE